MKETPIDEWYAIEEWIEPDIAISGIGFWYELPDSKTKDSSELAGMVGKLRSQLRKIRAVYYQKIVMYTFDDQ